MQEHNLSITPFAFPAASSPNELVNETNLTHSNRKKRKNKKKRRGYKQFTYSAISEKDLGVALCPLSAIHVEASKKVHHALLVAGVWRKTDEKP
jgi:hypothetical protein